MPLESFRHSSYFGKCYALTIIYNLTIPRGLEWKNFWKTKTWYNWYFKYYSLFIFHGSRLFSKSGIKRIVEFLLGTKKFSGDLIQFSPRRNMSLVKQRTIERSLLSWHPCYVIKKKAKCCRSCGNRTTLTIW